MRKKVLVTLMVVFSGGVFFQALGGYDFYILDNDSDSLYRSNTDNVSDDVFLATYGEGHWIDLAPSNIQYHLFATYIPMEGQPSINYIRESDGQITSSIVVDQPLRSIAFDQTRNIFYGISFSSENYLYTLDLATGVTTFVGDTSISSTITALVYNPKLDWLFASTQAEDLYRIDSTDGSASLIGNLGLSQVFGLAFNPFNELMYVTDAKSDSLYILDPDSAVVEFVGGPYTLSEYGTGLSFSNPIPEPCTLILLGLGAAMVRRKR